MKTRKPLETLAVFGLQSFRPHVLAEDEGFEPPQTESESGVLPLHKSSMRTSRDEPIIPNYSEKSRIFLKNALIFSGAEKALPAAPRGKNTTY